jgi:hypothetical protein
MNAACSFETLALIYESTWHHIIENCVLDNYQSSAIPCEIIWRYEVLKSSLLYMQH